jgi:hypothetical protein
VQGTAGEEEGFHHCVAASLGCCSQPGLAFLLGFVRLFFYRIHTVTNARMAAELAERRKKFAVP